jgi:transposase-like protein
MVAGVFICGTFDALTFIDCDFIGKQSARCISVATFFIDEVFVRISGRQLYLWRAVDQDGEAVDVFLQAKRDGAAAKRFFKRLLRSHGGEPRISAFAEWSRAVA